MIKKQEKYHVVGLMSGTSLDGLDIAYVEFELKEKWHFKLGKCETIPYTEEWRDQLSNLHKQSSIKIQHKDIKYGMYIGGLTQKFIKKNKIQVDFICSHGHTIFHQPENNYTLQIGDGQSISSQCQKTVICDFRSLDISLGGQGAPLVPIGDHLLFEDYNYCLNLGGFSNISYKSNNIRKAFDICPVNIVLNYLAQKVGYTYDKNGEIAKSGNKIDSLFTKLNQLPYYEKKGPKSLGNEWVEKYIQPLFNQYSSVPDLLHTFTEHAAFQIGKNLQEGSCLVTGGGAFNNYLIKRLKRYAKTNIYLPEKRIIDYKEALIFAFLGVLRYRNEVNCLSSVTGAKFNCSGGVIFTP